MVSWKSIDELKNIFIDKYINSSLQSELEKACSEEYELKRDYNGRQILELLQNVDDAIDDSKIGQDVKVNISYKDRILEVGNSGTVFTDESLERLCLGRSSEKNSKKIGNKGTGFRSLLNDAEWIEIHSGHFAVRFSDKYAQSLFDYYCDSESENHSEKIVSQQKNWKKDYKLCFPIMNCPQEIPFDSKGFDTLIRVKVKEENDSKETSVRKQLDYSFYKSLLFLPKITQILIDTDSSHKEYYKVVDNEYVKIKESIDGLKTKEEEYLVFPKKAEILGKQADLAIAVPKDPNYDFSKEKVYCFFPIRNVTTPIHALIHAPFITNNSRDDIPDDVDQVNRKIILAIFHFIKEVSEKESVREIITLPITTVTQVAECKFWNKEGFNLSLDYLNVISQAKILPTVTHKLISVEENPKIYDFPFPEELYQPLFDDLLTHLPSVCKTFVRSLAAAKGRDNLTYSEQELYDKINKISLNANCSTRVTIFLWWSLYFKKSSYLPQLIKSTNDSWITLQSRVYLPTDDGVSELPEALSWAKLDVLSQDYLTEMVSQIKTSNPIEWEYSRNKYSSSPSEKRILADYSKDYLAVNFIEQSSSDLIVSTINQQVDSFDKSISFINWFFDKYGYDLKKGSELSKVLFRLPDVEKNIRPINELYLITEANKSIAKKLFDKTSIKEIAPLEWICKKENVENFKDFLKKCLILEFPKIIDQSLIGRTDFKNFVKETYFQNLSINYLYSKVPNGFENLIATLETIEIVDWLLNDEDLRAVLISQEKGSYAQQQINWSKNYFHSNAYIKYVLNNTPWIQFGEKKYPPSKIIKYEKIKQHVDGYYGASEQELVGYLGRDIVLLFDLDFKESIALLPDNELKIFLDKLPSFDKGEISRKLYIDILKNKKDKKPNYSVSNLKVLAKDGKFYANNQVTYSDRKISRVESDSNKFIYIQPKQSTETVLNWLGVERYKSKLMLKDYGKIEESSDFNDEIRDIKIAILCGIDNNKKNVDALKRLEIIPCSFLEVNDIEQENKDIFLDDYFFVENRNSFYIKLPNGYTLSELRQSDDFAQSIFDIFKQHLTLGLDSDRIELLVSKDSENKKQKIQDLYGVDSWNDSYELLFNKKHENETIVKYFVENGLVSSLINNLEKIDFTEELSNENCEVLIDALEKISRDVDEINNLDKNNHVSLVPFYERNIQKLMDSKFEDYKTKLYCALKNSKDYSAFLDKLEAYKNFDIKKFDLQNSRNVNLEKILYDAFDVLKKDCIDVVNPDKEYNSNVKNLIETFGLKHENFDYYIQNHKKEKSQLYFEIPSKIGDDIKSFISGSESCNHQEKNNDVESVVTGTENITLLPVTMRKEKSAPNQGKTEKSEDDYKNGNAKNEASGKEAEKIAYTELKKTFEKLVWHSKYSTVHADRNNPPPNRIVCDMWNNDPENGNTYFEIKSSVAEFEMSINEYNSMKDHRESYEVVLVNRDTKKISRHKFDEIDGLKRVNSYKFRYRKKAET